MYSLSLSFSVTSQSWSDTRAACVPSWGEHGRPAVYGRDGGVSVRGSLEVQHVGEHGGKVSQRLPWLQDGCGVATHNRIL